MSSQHVHETIQHHAFKAALLKFAAASRKLRRNREKRPRTAWFPRTVTPPMAASDQPDPVKIAVLAMDSVGRASMRAAFTGVEVKVDLLGAAPPVTCGVDHPAALAMRAAYKEAFGKETSLIRVGGSIPVSIDFQEAVGAPLVISGIAQSDSAVHSPNERLVIDNYYRGIDAVIRFICGLART